MDAALLALVALACPIGMVLMMVFMGRGLMSAREGESRSSSPPHERADDPNRLGAEKRRRLEPGPSRLPGRP